MTFLARRYMNAQIDEEGMRGRFSDVDTPRVVCRSRVSLCSHSRVLPLSWCSMHPFDRRQSHVHHPESRLLRCHAGLADVTLRSRNTRKPVQSSNPRRAEWRSTDAFTRKSVQLRTPITHVVEGDSA